MRTSGIRVLAGLAGAVALHFAGGPQVGDIGDAESAKDAAARVVQPAQLAGPEQPTGPYPGLLRYVTKIPRPRQLPEIDCH